MQANIVPLIRESNNAECTLRFNRRSNRGKFVDYIIDFPNPQTDVETIMENTKDLVIKLCEWYSEYDREISS